MLLNVACIDVQDTSDEKTPLTSVLKHEIRHLTVTYTAEFWLLVAPDKNEYSEHNLNHSFY